jgi:tetratricopeptide (TPR) repeat protein
MRRWKVTAFFATIFIILSVPLYLLKTSYLTPFPGDNQSEVKYNFVGSLKCADCHRKEYDKWQDSQHDHAMDIANDKAVLGDFNNVLFKSHGVTSRFFKENGRFFVHTQGPNGQMKDYEITYTFGWYPLQQYLVPFEGGRLQCLPIAWDDHEKKWYDLYPDDPIDPTDWLYWTNAGQNWNGMCAECHSTNLKKNYDLKSDSYKTTWTDIDVGCEACHGPGSGHVGWAETPDMGRPTVNNYNLIVRTSGIASRELVNLCAPCHSRRAILGDYTHAEPNLLDSMLPSLLTPELYFPDGQILQEVYIYGSFIQSKMYQRDVRCSDCHDSHSVKPVKEGNDLCLQCHKSGEYDTVDHHFHKRKGENGEPIKSSDGKILFDVGTGAECVQCHIPGRNYMVIDYRPDHSFRIPRPALSDKINAPNACNRCHIDKTTRWSDEWITKWYGPGRTRHYGMIIDAGRKHKPEAYGDLIKLALDSLYPVNVRATALSILSEYPGKETLRAFEISLMDNEALIRRTAIENLDLQDVKEKVRLISPLLLDPVKAVRIEAAFKLAGEPSDFLDDKQQIVFQEALKEFIASMEYSGDFAFGRFNLGNLYSTLDETQKSISHYKAAIKIDNLFYPAKVNLAMLYNSLGDNEQAENLFRQVIEENRELYQIYYSLGLLLAEKKEYDEAAAFMEKAAANMPESARIHYNYGLLLQFLKRDSEAEVELYKALSLEPENMDFLYALADYYLKRSNYKKAREFAEIMIKVDPDQPVGHDLLNIILKNQQME